jgi:hypothetical protein
LSFDSSAASRWLKSFLLVNLGQCFVNQIQRVVEIGAPLCTSRPLREFCLYDSAPGELLCEDDWRKFPFAPVSGFLARLGLAL